ncbi:hypothetical protein E6P78_25900 [Streptomyces sp. A0958]|nr:hypothetical protein E6P78_25900 [Streptomyces sp. A0958]
MICKPLRRLRSRLRQGAGRGQARRRRPAPALRPHFSDPAAPSTRESVIMKPDDKIPGGPKVVRPAEAAAARSYTVGWTFLRGWPTGGTHRACRPPVLRVPVSWCRPPVPRAARPASRCWR